MKGFSLQRQHWQQLNRLFMARNRRERWLLLGAGWALLAWLGLLLFEATVLARQRQLVADNQQLSRTIAERQQQGEALKARIAGLSNTDQKQQIERLNRRLARLDNSVQGRLQSLVGPEQMAELLLAVLEQDSGLQLVQLQNRPAQAITTQGGNTLYRHGISLQLTGSYVQLLDYVRRLELLQGKLFWQSLGFELEQYPVARIRLDFFTLSEHKELLRG
ncbi:MSHA biogenesis protein MshJ [Zobellella aerophila]|uniref:MSHA biogenesis protein MshJ n=1 Tax=Zobellella aerophila TaxID=870480 RepID=A0ABP6VBE1_9GAMM